MTNDRNSSIRWALVTGATRGIGLALARGLAHRGYGLILVARSEEGLQQAAHQLRKEGAVAVEYTPIDLAASGAAERLHRLYGEWLVDVVVNNAGTFVYRDLVECNGERVAHIVGLHIVATTELCRLFGASMARRGKGYILNMSSYAAWVSMGGIGALWRNKELCGADELLSARRTEGEWGECHRSSARRCSHRPLWPPRCVATTRGEARGTHDPREGCRKVLGGDVPRAPKGCAGANE